MSGPRIDVENVLHQQRRTIEEQGKRIAGLLGRVDSLERLVLAAWDKSERKEKRCRKRKTTHPV